MNTEVYNRVDFPAKDVSTDMKHFEEEDSTFKIVEVPGIKPATSWSVVRHPNPKTSRASYY